jgi:hypothetical protein
MAIRQPRYSKEEFTRRGDALYESEIRAQVEVVKRQFRGSLATKPVRQNFLDPAISGSPIGVMV